MGLASYFRIGTMGDFYDCNSKTPSKAKIFCLLQKAISVLFHFWTGQFFEFVHELFAYSKYL